MKSEDQTALMILGAICIAVGVGFGSKDWTLGVSALGVMLYAMPVFIRK
jgi:hypothetical protein